MKDITIILILIVVIGLIMFSLYLTFIGSYWDFLPMNLAASIVIGVLILVFKKVIKVNKEENNGDSTYKEN